MSAHHRSILGWAALITALNVGVTLALVRWGSPPVKADAGKAAAAQPATVTRTVNEADLNIITLTPEAESHLALKTAPVERRPVARVRSYGGEVVVPAGRSVSVVAPMAGTLQAAGGGAGSGHGAGAPVLAGASATSPATSPAMATTLPPTAPASVPAPGSFVRKGTPLFTLSPMLTTEARTNLATALVDAEGAVGAADVQVKSATVALNRAKQLLADKAGSEKAVDDAQAQYELAEKALEAARVRRDLLLRTVRDAQSDAVPPWVVEAPTDGVLRAVYVLPGQTVPAGAPLFEVAQLDRLWVRVPVYMGDLDEIDADKPATVGPLGGRVMGGPTTRPGQGGSTTRPAMPARTAPPSADPAAATADLFYELDNQDGSYDPGQRVSVTLPLRGEEQSLVAPWAAVFRDIHGNAWVFEKTGPHAYTRRRVIVRSVVGDTAVLAAGPAPGAAVVTDGSAELAGREFGFAK